MDIKQNEFLNQVVKVKLEHISGITSRAMFGGYGLYKDGITFAIIAEDKLYFKTGPSNAADYKNKNSHPFIYQQGNHKKTTMSYWSVPDEILNDQDKLKEWVNKSVVASKKSKKK